MRPSDIQDQLESLRAEVRDMNALLQRIQAEDVRRVYGGQIKSVLAERAHRFFGSERRTLGKGPHIWLDAFEERVMTMIDQTITAYQLADQESAIKVLEGFVTGAWPRRIAGILSTLQGPGRGNRPAVQ